jgi:hypothetical protein
MWGFSTIVSGAVYRPLTCCPTQVLRGSSDPATLARHTPNHRQQCKQQAKRSGDEPERSAETVAWRHEEWGRDQKTNLHRDIQKHNCLIRVCLSVSRVWIVAPVRVRQPPRIHRSKKEYGKQKWRDDGSHDDNPGRQPALRKFRYTPIFPTCSDSSFRDSGFGEGTASAVLPKAFQNRGFSPLRATRALLQHF